MTKIVIVQQNGSATPTLSITNGSCPAKRPGGVRRNPRTEPQQKHRSILAAVSAEWRSLNDEAREGWRTLGNQLSRRLTGHQAYTKINMALAQCGLPGTTLPTSIPAFGQLRCTGLEANDTPQVKLVQMSSTLPADRLIIEATPPLGQGLKNVHNRFCVLTIEPGPAAVPVDLDLTAAYNARFLQPRAGQRIFVRLTAMSNGFKGAPLVLSAIVAKQEISGVASPCQLAVGPAVAKLPARPTSGPFAQPALASPRARVDSGALTKRAATSGFAWLRAGGARGPERRSRATRQRGHAPKCRPN